MENSDHEHIYSVSELNREVFNMLSSSFGVIWIEGEISNFVKSAAGHAYFSLKDESSQIRCAMFRQRNQLVDFKIENGKQILVKAKVGLYEARGDYQLIIEYLEEAGEGLLRQRFELLKNKLEREGLFDRANKLSLPRFPQKLGIISSSSGAAIQDIFNIIRRRFPSVDIFVYPTQVQGSQATKQICQAIETANDRNECELLILARGGGSLEDLWCFNEEDVARAIFQSRIPIISGIGHETNLTIADMVADHRAPTPSGAAEIALPDSEEIRRQLTGLEKQLYTNMKLLLNETKQQWLSFDSKLQQQHPVSLMEQYNQRFDLVLQRIKPIPKEYISRISNKINALNTRLFRSTPLPLSQEMKSETGNFHGRLISSIQEIYKNKEQLLFVSMAKLDGVSPLNTLDRGYAYVTEPKTKKHIRSIEQIKTGLDTITRLKDGTFDAKISRVDSLKPMDEK